MVLDDCVDYIINNGFTTTQCSNLNDITQFWFERKTLSGVCDLCLTRDYLEDVEVTSKYLNIWGEIYSDFESFKKRFDELIATHLNAEYCTQIKSMYKGSTKHTYVNSNLSSILHSMHERLCILENRMKV